jgi:integrase
VSPKYALFKRGEIWHYRFQVDGKRIQRTTRERHKAGAVFVAEAAYREALIRSHGDEPCPSMASLVELWLKAHGIIAGPDHLKSVETFGRLHLYGLRDLLVSDLTTEKVETALAAHLQGRAKATANHWMTTLRLLVNWAIRRRMIRRREWDVKPLKIQHRPRVTLAPAQTRTWLDALDSLCANAPGLKIVARLAMGLGLRGSEAAGARWEWLDWERMTYVPGRLLETGEFATKGGEADPLPITEWLADYLWPIRMNRGLIAPNPHGKPFSVARLRALMKSANAKAGTPGLSPHRLRGTYATLLIEAGVPIQDVQAAMRHKDPRTTLGYTERDMARVALGQKRMAHRQGLTRRENGADPSAAIAHPAFIDYPDSSAAPDTGNRP